MVVPWYLMAGAGGDGTKTATGPVVTFRGDGSPLRSLLVNIDPVQDLHGYDAPYPPGGGKNKADYPGMITAGAVEQTDGSLYVATAVSFQNKVIFQNDGTAGQFSLTFIVKNDGTSRGLYPNIVYTDSTSESMSINRGYESFTTFTKVSNSSKTVDKIIFNYGTGSVKTWFYVQVESGSTPTAWSPYSNICPISGWDGMTVYHSGADTSDPTTYPITWQSAGTVYGGTLDVTNGVLTVDRAMVDLGNLTYIYLSQGNNVFYAPLTDAKSNTGIGNLPNLKSSQYKTTTAKTVAEWSTTSEDAVISLGYDSARVYIRNSAYTDAATFQSAMSGVQLVYELATPITIQLTPTQINTLQGQNNLWADTGDSMVEYAVGWNPALMKLAVAFMGEGMK